MQLISHFERAARLNPNRVAFVQPDGSEISYRASAQIVQTIAQALRAEDLEPASTVAIYSPNDAAGFLAIMGVVRAGFVWISLNSRNPVENNISLARTSEAKAIFFHSQFEAEADRIRQSVDGLSVCVCLDKRSDLGPSLDELAPAPEGGIAELEDENARPCTIFATGGTTGLSKGAVWTNRTWETLIANFWTCAPAAEHPVHLCVAPMTHAAGILALMLLPRAPTNVVMTETRPVAILEAIQRHKVTHLFLPPTVLYSLLSEPTLKDYDTSSLLFFLISAAPVSAAKLREAVAAFGPVMFQSYGQAEAPFFLTYLSAQDHVRAVSSDAHARLLNSCGRATMFAEVEIMDDDGHILPPEEPGEIVARGNLIMEGYYRDPKATADVSQHGWHHTGDIGMKDRNGYIYIVDRKRDMIITGGFNVFSTEVENAMLSHPAVLDCAVIGIPDEKWGEAIKAVVELKSAAAASPDELIAHCKAALGSVKAPKTVDIWDTLPRSPVGKVLKRTVRDKYWQGQNRCV